MNVYGNKKRGVFDSISNLFSVDAVDECFDTSITGPVSGIKDEFGNWNIKGHPDRVIHVSGRVLKLFAMLFDGSAEWKQARLPSLHANEMLDVLSLFNAGETTVSTLGDDVFSTEMLHETYSQDDGTIVHNEHFPRKMIELVYSGPMFCLGNPLYQSAWSSSNKSHEYSNVDLMFIPNDYSQRCKYEPACSENEFIRRAPKNNWGTSYISDWRVQFRLMVGSDSERTLQPIIAPPMTSHIDTVFGMTFRDIANVPLFAGVCSSVPYDFYIKVRKKRHVRYDVVSNFPLLSGKKQSAAIKLRALLLNCLSNNYAALWKSEFTEEFSGDEWSKMEPRLCPERFSRLSSEWSWNTPLRTDYERRQALVEIDVLTAMALGMTLDQLKTIYRIQFPVLQQYETDTWYDANGRIVFTTNRSLTSVGYDRKEWETNLKGAPAGKKFWRTITDDTKPGGPVQRTIEYVAPFDRCDREQDYETAWKFFEEKYKKERQ